MKKKIIFVTKALWIGGIETALVNLLKNFDYEKYDVTLLVLRAELDMLENIPRQCRVLIIDRERSYSFEKAYKYSRLFHLTEESQNPSLFHKAMMWTVPAIRWIENNLYIQYVRDLMKDEKFDTAIIYSDVIGEITIKAIHAKKYLMYYHHGAMRHVYHDEIAWRTCEKIIAVSNNQAGLLKEYFPKYKDKISVIHNLTDIEGIQKKSEMSIKERFDQDCFNIVSVGRVSHEKGMDIAVQVCAKLVALGITNLKWWIVGDGPAMQEVKDTVSETHMEKYVITVGMKTNPYPYIKRADLYVQPSRFEGYPMTILESLILGQPVVSTNNNGAKEILVNGESGYLEIMEIDALANRIKLLINDPILLKSIKDKVQDIDFEQENKKCILQLEKIL